MSRPRQSLLSAPTAGKAGSSRQQRRSGSSGSAPAGGRPLQRRATALGGARLQRRQRRHGRQPGLLPPSGTTAARRLSPSRTPASWHRRAQGEQQQRLPLVKRMPTATAAASRMASAAVATANVTKRSGRRRTRRWAAAGGVSGFVHAACGAPQLHMVPCRRCAQPCCGCSMRQHRHSTYHSQSKPHQHRRRRRGGTARSAAWTRRPASSSRSLPKSMSPSGSAAKRCEVCGVCEAGLWHVTSC